MRFKEFSGEWIRYKLEKVANIYDGTHQTPNYKKTGIPFVSVEDIKDINAETKFISAEEYNKNFKIHPERGDILMTRIGDIGTPAIIDFDKEMGYYVSLALLRPLNIKTKFLNYYIQTKVFKKELWIRTIHEAFPIKINKEQIGKCNLKITSLKEQQKIADFLTLIDNRIETQMKIIEEIKSLKNSIVIKIFGDKSIFTNKWKKNKLSEILTERKQYAQKGSKYTHVTLSKEGVVDKTDRYNRDFLVKDEEKEYKVTKLNDICYNPANLKFGVICLNKYGDAIFSPIYVTYEINQNYSPLFIELALTNSTFIGHIRKYEQGTVYERMAVSSEDFLKGTVRVPSVEEQNHIVKTFNNIDRRLEIEKRIMDKLKKQKSYLLNNMFI